MMKLMLVSLAGALLLIGPAAAAGSAPGSAAPMSLEGTSWEFDDRGEPTIITIDRSGAYVENRVSGRHVVHGTYRQVGGKDCFTSSMGERRTSCWTAVPQTRIGEVASATSDSGIKAVFKRVPYRRLQIPR